MVDAAVRRRRRRGQDGAALRRQSALMPGSWRHYRAPLIGWGLGACATTCVQLLRSRPPGWLCGAHRCCSLSRNLPRAAGGPTPLQMAGWPTGASGPSWPHSPRAARSLPHRLGGQIWHPAPERLAPARAPPRTGAPRLKAPAGASPPPASTAACGAGGHRSFEFFKTPGQKLMRTRWGRPRRWLANWGGAALGPCGLVAWPFAGVTLR